jgi:hypothetical protein
MTNMRILTFSELIATIWPGVDLVEEFGQGMLKFVHFPTRLPAPRCDLLEIITPSTAASVQAEHKDTDSKWHTARFFVTPVGSVTNSLLEKVVNSARPLQVVMDSDTLAPDLRADCGANTKQAIWMDEGEPPVDWAEQTFSELL